MLFLLLNILLLMPQVISAQEVTYSSVGYTIVAPDNSTKVEFVNGRAVGLSINGAWNRLSNDIAIEDRASQFNNFDLYFGTYSSLATNSQRPSYNTVANDNSVDMDTIVTINGQQISVKRTVTLLRDGQMTETLSLSNISSERINLDFEGLAFSFGSLFDISRATTNNSNIPEYKYYNGEKIQKSKIGGGSWFGSATPMDFIQNPKWITIADNFFMFVAEPKFDNTVVVYNGLEFAPKSRVGTGIQVLATNIAPNQTLEYKINYYVGPRLESMIVPLNIEYKKLFAWPVVFNWILKPIENGTIWLLSTLVEKTGSAGWTLVLIAIFVKLMLLPLSIRSALSMKKMRLLQPKLNKLQEKFGHDQQLVQMKTMELYKAEKVNPMGGCLPLLLQIPVFFALFRVLSRSVLLRGANFLWINDLTMPDHFFTIGSFPVHLLPIIMTILQLVSVFLQQGRMGSSQNEMQKQMQTQSYLMPVMFLFLFWGMPSGLVAYWTVQNIFSILEQECINLKKS